jgi:hypothetical protein
MNTGGFEKLRAQMAGFLPYAGYGLHLLLKVKQTAVYSTKIWRPFRK